MEPVADLAQECATLDTLHAAYPDCAGQTSLSVCATPSPNAGRRQPFEMIGSVP